MKHVAKLSLAPAWVCLLVLASAYVTILALRVELRFGGDVTALFCVGDTKPIPSLVTNQNFFVHSNWEGYDGEYALFLSFDPLLRTGMARGFDKPAYRSQRIGLPLLAHALALGKPAALPSTMIALNLVALLVSGWFFLKILKHVGASPWWVLAYGFSPGFLSAELRVLPDATAMSLIFIALWAVIRGRWMPAALLLSLGTLVRETTLLASLALFAWVWLHRDRRGALWFLLPLAVYGVWASYVTAQVGAWPYTAGFDWPMTGIVGKILLGLKEIAVVQGKAGKPVAAIVVSIAVEAVFNIGLLYSCYLAIHRLKDAAREWLTYLWCAYALLAVMLSIYQWCQYWHLARVLDPLVLLPLLVYQQTRERRYLVPLLCAVPVSVMVLFSPR